VCLFSGPAMPISHATKNSPAENGTKIGASTAGRARCGHAYRAYAQLGVPAMRPLSSPRNGIRRLGTVRRWSPTPAPRNRPVLQMTHDARASSLLICWCPYRRPGVPGAVVLQAARGDAVEIAHVSTRVHPTSVFSARACCVSYRLTSPIMLTEVMHRFTVSPSDFTRCSGFSQTALHDVRGAAGLSGVHVSIRLPRHLPRFHCLLGNVMLYILTSCVRRRMAAATRRL